MSEKELSTMNNIPENNNELTKSADNPSTIPVSLSAIPQSQLSQVPQSTSTIQQSISIIPQSISTIPQSISTIPQSISTIPQSISIIPQSTSTIPQSTSTIPQSNSTILQSISTIPQSNSMIPQSTSTIPQSNSTIPQSISTIPQSNSTIPQSCTTISPSTVPQSSLSQSPLPLPQPCATATFPQSIPTLPQSPTAIPHYHSTIPEAIPASYPNASSEYQVDPSWPNAIWQQDLQWTYETTVLMPGFAPGMPCDGQPGMPGTSFAAGGSFPVTGMPESGVKWKMYKGDASGMAGIPGGPDVPGVPGMPGMPGMSRGSSREDLTSSLSNEQTFEYEDRFRVDRRKLELLILGRFDPIKDSANDFFTRIAEESGAVVIWPSRLKIGAKSKKDPHIRLGGTEDSVKRAKASIMEHLDTKTSRVTLKMDVSYTDHSHVIGKGGNTIRRVMAETNCHIHFPDSNRSNPHEKSNQVSLAGEMVGVEHARAKIRELSPLVFELPLIPSAPDPNDPYLRAIQEQYNVQAIFRQKHRSFQPTTMSIKGSDREASRVEEATRLLMKHFCGSASLSVTIHVEISPQHHAMVMGKGTSTLEQIMQSTNTVILFPDAGDPNIPPIKKGSVTITGPIHNVYLARQQLLGCLPLVLMFDLPDDVQVDEQIIQKLQDDFEVNITIKPKVRQNSKSVIIKAYKIQ